MLDCHVNYQIWLLREETRTAYHFPAMENTTLSFTIGALMRDSRDPVGGN